MYSTHLAGTKQVTYFLPEEFRALLGIPGDGNVFVWSDGQDIAVMSDKQDEN